MKKMSEFKIDSNEALNIIISVLVISFAFAIVFSGVSTLSIKLAYAFLLILITVGLGFILHEMAHKYVAIKYGLQAKYVMWTLGLLLAIIMAVLLGFVFAAPGATYIWGGNVNTEENGKISLAGPLTNLALAIVFAPLIFIPALSEVGLVGVQVNLFLGAFNMIPIFPLDGSKVLAWDWRIWLVSIIALAAPLVILL
ncbi:MAG: site-2 protease family protein [Candidatus Marsarchaeota archaeon]|nr:site-2 protease family protein [Candidatus Marsarchaeota archaeon]